MTVDPILWCKPPFFQWPVEPAGSRGLSQGSTGPVEIDDPVIQNIFDGGAFHNAGMGWFDYTVPPSYVAGTGLKIYMLYDGGPFNNFWTGAIQVTNSGDGHIQNAALFDNPGFPSPQVVTAPGNAFTIWVNSNSADWDVPSGFAAIQIFTVPDLNQNLLPGDVGNLGGGVAILRNEDGSTNPPENFSYVFDGLGFAEPGFLNLDTEVWLDGGTGASAGTPFETVSLASGMKLSLVFSLRGSLFNPINIWGIVVDAGVSQQQIDLHRVYTWKDDDGTNFGGPIFCQSTPYHRVSDYPWILIEIFRRVPAAIFPPVISGSAAHGSVLTLSNHGIWRSLPSSYTFQWQLDGADIVGQTGSTYTSVISDVGHDVTCLVTAHGVLGDGTPATGDCPSNAITIT